MIGLVAKLAKAAKLAQTAEAAIDVASNKLAPGDEKSGDGESSEKNPAGAAEHEPEVKISEFDESHGTAPSMFLI